MGARQRRLSPLSRRGMGTAGQGRRGNVRAALAGGVPVRPVLAHDLAQAGELPRRLRRVRPGGRPGLLGRYAEAPPRPPVTTADIPAWTPASKACARDLKRLGFTFTGPV